MTRIQIPSRNKTDLFRKIDSITAVISVAKFRMTIKVGTETSLNANILVDNIMAN
jgi:hypothetical protein